jgi:CHAT domain-containing protein
LPALGQRLYAALIKPAEPSLKNATTVLLCPEGALNQLPWGALIVAVDKQGRPTYWVERVAIGLTLSAGVYLQAKAVRPAERGVAIAAVSQYRRLEVAQAPKTAQLVRRSGRALGDLPAVKQEVAQLRQLLGKQGVAVVQEARRRLNGRVRWRRGRGWCILPATRGQMVLTRWGRGCCCRLRVRTRGC